MSTIYIKKYKAPEYNYNEILRYSKVNEDSVEMNTLINSCINELQNNLQYMVCYSEYPISFIDTKINNSNNNTSIDLGFMNTTSSNLQKNLKGCTHIIVFAATIGLHIDRLIAKYSNSSPVKALIFQAIGAERIESLCNLFNADIDNEKKTLGLITKPRFSPGYGDFPIESQKYIFEALNCPKNIGLTLNDSLIMSPSKSVTAIIGISMPS